MSKLDQILGLIEDYKAGSDKSVICSSLKVILKDIGLSFVGVQNSRVHYAIDIDGSVYLGYIYHAARAKFGVPMAVCEQINKHYYLVISDIVKLKHLDFLNKKLSEIANLLT